MNEQGRTAILPTLDCQDCGKALMTLDAEQAQRMASEPYNFIAYCRRCGNEPEAEQNGSPGDV